MKDSSDFTKFVNTIQDNLRVVIKENLKIELR